tara:strand:- start:763 stop:993 length:231 start_codon:yes stop_codon:yes gene_type:complete
MESYTSEEDLKDKFTVEQGSAEEGFIKGFENEDDPEECAECGAAINPEKLVVREIDGEKRQFCSEDCAKDFEESVN